MPRKKKTIYLKELRKIVKVSTAVFTRQQMILAFLKTPWAHYSPLLADYNYTTLTKEAWDKFLEWSDVDKRPYRPDVGDCDNFALWLASDASRKIHVNSVAEIWDFDAAHAYCALAVHKDGKLSLKAVEPQTDGSVRLMTRQPKIDSRGGIILMR